MSKFFQKVAASVLAAAIIGNATFLFRVNERLARLETKLELLTGKSLANNTHEQFTN